MTHAQSRTAFGQVGAAASKPALGVGRRHIAAEGSQFGPVCKQRTLHGLIGDEFAGVVLSRTTMEGFWERYTAGRDLGHDPFVAPLQAPNLGDLPPAIVLLGGCDPLRDEGRLYAARLREDGCAVEELCCGGQPHGFINFQLPAAADAFQCIGAWSRSVLTTDRESRR